MQSGTTGINTLRIYDPVKQGYDHDPQGTFIKRWIPELAALPPEIIHEPWKMTPLDLRQFGIELGNSYPNRIVDHAVAVKRAREVLATFRKKPETRGEAKAVLHKHGSRSSGTRRSRSASKTSSKQRPSRHVQVSLFESD